MAIAPISVELKQAGREMLAALDDIGLQPNGAMWLYFHNIGDWRFAVVSDLVPALGRTKIYGLIDAALAARKPVEGLTIFDVQLAAPDELFVRVISKVFQVHPGVEVTLGNVAIDNVPVEAFIYRLLPPRSASEVRSSSVRFSKSASVRSRNRAIA